MLLNLYLLFYVVSATILVPRAGIQVLWIILVTLVCLCGQQCAASGSVDSNSSVDSDSAAQ